MQQLREALPWEQAPRYRTHGKGHTPVTGVNADHSLGDGTSIVEAYTKRRLPHDFKFATDTWLTRCSPFRRVVPVQFIKELADPAADFISHVPKNLALPFRRSLGLLRIEHTPMKDVAGKRP